MEHKIQSGAEGSSKRGGSGDGSGGGLQLSLSKVPKVLGLLVSAWAPHATVVSFKLETDSAILVQKVLLMRVGRPAFRNRGGAYIITSPTLQFMRSLSFT